MFLSPPGSSPLLLQLQTHLVYMMHLTDVCGYEAEVKAGMTAMSADG